MADGSGVEILLVEDNPEDLELTLHALKKYKLGSRIQVVRDGAEALDFRFCTGAYAGRDFADKSKVILLDLKLPKVDGLEVLRRIKSEPKTSSIPVVLMTGPDRRGTPGECRGQSPAAQVGTDGERHHGCPGEGHGQT